MSQAESAARQSVLICSIVCTVVVVAITAIRLYTRILLVMGLGSDDYSLVFAVAGWFAMMALFVVAPKYGLGTHLADVDPSKQDMFIRVMIAAGTLYNTVMLACKLSILLLYRRLFPIQNFTKRWWCVAIFTISYSVVVAVASAFGRTPVAAKWYISETGDSCPSKWAFYVANAAFNLISDIFILILPLPVIWNLSLELRQKITLFILFALGSAIIRLQSIILFLKDDDGDITFQTTKLAIWCLVETTISIVCVCAPTLRPFFRRYFGSFFSWSGSGSNSDGRNGNRLYFSSFFRSTRYGRQTSRSHNNHSLPGHSNSNFPPHLSAHHRTMIAAESLELGNPQKTDAHVEVGHVVDVEAGGMLPDYDARSTDHIIDEHKAGVIGLARDSEELGSEGSGRSSRGGRRGSGMDLGIHVQTSYEVRHDPA
ncbi:hypothetical protein GTA08_BOTSDO09187 [Neofusicoccum parvum]|uniref:Uncharacterized protein n=1 Tax=Neofusicoccum parvum TaxID=310453 RepID=A0ACB5S9K1_9PEZI|nr:hypothetical protein GTA08_BOTSDO09187 [Neofusicoccum parvum]